MAEEVGDMNAEALSWVPAGETNSVSTLVVHALGSELETLRYVTGLGSDRDRDAEFTARVDSATALLERIREADASLDQLGGTIRSDDLSEERLNPRRGPNTGIYWLLNNYGHAREHLAHLQLTKQLYLTDQRAKR
jgi:hypothetical protein